MRTIFCRSNLFICWVLSKIWSTPSKKLLIIRIMNLVRFSILWKKRLRRANSPLNQTLYTSTVNILNSSSTSKFLHPKRILQSKSLVRRDQNLTQAFAPTILMNQILSQKKKRSHRQNNQRRSSHHRKSRSKLLKRDSRNRLWKMLHHLLMSLSLHRWHLMNSRMAFSLCQMIKLWFC